MKNRKRFFKKLNICSKFVAFIAGFMIIYLLQGRCFAENPFLTEQPEEETETVFMLDGMQKAYTVKINELVFSLSSKAEVIKLIEASKAKLDPENKFEVCLKMDPGRQLEAITAYLKLREGMGNSQFDMSFMDAGVAKRIDEVMQYAGAAVSESQEIFDDAREKAKSTEGYNGTDAQVGLSLEELSFADNVEIAVAYMSPEDLTDLEEAIAAVTSDKQTEQIYEVQPGDTLSEIALKHDIPMDELVEINDTLESADSMIRAGDELSITVPLPELSYIFTERMYYEENYNAPIEYIDNDDWYTTDQVTRQDPVAGYHRVIADVSYKNAQELSRNILTEQVIMEPVAKIVERGTKIPPTYVKPISGGRLSSGFGKRKAPKKGASTYHRGIDWATPIGTAVMASCGGVVSRAGWGSGYGNVVYIDHPDGRQTRYGHLSKVLVKPGDHVSQNQKVALSGNTGRSTGPHLHFEILINGGQVNPLNYLN